MGVPRMHEAQIDVPDALVRALVDDQFPQWSGLPLAQVPSAGTIHRVDRLGDGLVVRLPVIDWALDDVARDAVRLPRLAAALAARVPMLVGRGVPADGMPWDWGVYSWLDGRHAVPGRDDGAVADGLVAAIRALRAMPAEGPPSQAVFHAAAADALTRSKVEALADTAPWALDVWDEAIAAGPQAGTAGWIHGDLMPGNLLLNSDGRMDAILDWGASGVGDPALDLLGAWTCLGPGARRRMLAELGASAEEIARARGYAVRKVAWGLEYYRDSLPGFAAILARTLVQLGVDLDP